MERRLQIAQDRRDAMVALLEQCCPLVACARLEDACECFAQGLALRWGVAFRRRSETHGRAQLDIERLFERSDRKEFAVRALIDAVLGQAAIEEVRFTRVCPMTIANLL